MNAKSHPTLGNGKICYVEIPALDPQRSAAFYQAVFGWNVRRRGDGHLAFDDTVGEVSGSWVANRKPSTDPGVLVYIMVDDAAATLETIIAIWGRSCSQSAWTRPKSPRDSVIRPGMSSASIRNPPKKSKINVLTRSGRSLYYWKR